MIYMNKGFIKKFKWIELHDSIGQIKVSEPTESDINEGDFMRYVYFMDSNRNVYALFEQDVREDN